MVDDREDAVTSEVDKRLEDLFGENGEIQDLGDDSGTTEHSPLWDLKAIVLSIDWEITDEIMNRLTDQIERSKTVYKDDRSLLLFLQLLDSVGKYIKVNKADTHPDAIKLLNSVYTSLEKVALSKAITPAEKEKTLLFEVKRFKRLKERIAQKKADTVNKKAEAPPEKPPPLPKEPEPPPEAIEPTPEEVEITLDKPLPPVEEEVESEAAAEAKPAAEIPASDEAPTVPPPPPEPPAPEATPELEVKEIEVVSEGETRSPADQTGEISEPEPDQMTPHEAFVLALNEIKAVIKAEFEALRAELRLWRK